MRVAVLISGGGTTLRNLIQRHHAGQLAVEFAQVISSRVDAGGLAYAQARQIPTTVIELQRAGSLERFSEAIFDQCRKANVDLVVMGGFLKRVLVPTDFVNRVINIHPSLIPAFCGKGMYGLRVHQAVIDYGCKLSGCTVHFVDNEYDHGAIIAQRAVAVLPDDSAESLANRVFQAECELYPLVINAIGDRRVVVDGRTVVVKDSA